MREVVRNHVAKEVQWRVLVPLTLVVAMMVIVGCASVGAVAEQELLRWLLRMGMITAGLALVAFVALTTRMNSMPQSVQTVDSAQPADRRVPALEAKLADRTRMLQDAYVDMHSLDRVKEAFLSNLSHEMRTPLTSIMAAEEILTNYADEAPETRHEFLNIIRQESTRLLALMGRLLDLAKLEAKALQLHYERVDLCRLVDETVGSTLSQLPNLAMTVRIVKLEDAVVCECDRERIARVVHSMLENAVRYSPPSGLVVVTVSRVGGCASVQVQDAGDDTEERFSDMFEGECLDRRSTAGSPLLGHPIAARLVSLHGGTLTPTRAAEGGTIVSLLLPSKQVEVAADRIEEPESELAAQHS